MFTIFHSKLRQRGSILVMFTLMLPLIAGIVGLAIDGTMMYIVQAKLQTAVDGAALGAGRLLGTQANATEIATEFLHANYPSGFWGSYNLTPNITSTTSLSTHTITVSATVNVPTLFMRILHFDNATVGASAIATRRDSRVMLVLDRSGSMTSNLSTMKSAAYGFTSKFTPGTDELGLIVFSGSAFVAYPTNGTLGASATGPNVHFADPVSAGGSNMLTMINNMALGTYTNTSEALWLAYQELKKASLIDNDPTRLNAIVLFTDGVPNVVSAWVNDPSNNALSAASGCTYNPATAGNTATYMYGWMAGDPPGNTTALYILQPRDVSHTAQYWDAGSGGNVNEMVQVSGTPMAHCSGLGPGTSLGGLSKIPPQTSFGISTSGAAVPQSLVYSSYHTAYNSNQPSSSYQVSLAAWNAVDNTAQAILADTTMNIAIYCIGYTGNGGVDQALLKRIANTQDSTSYNQTYQTGKYVPAGNAIELQNAFNAVASALLRLAR
jgi:Flp pilus assembly protein TadG